MVFEIKVVRDGLIQLSGRLDAAQVEKARAVFDSLSNSQVVDCQELTYISSAGLSVLITTYKRLDEGGKALKLINVNEYIQELLRLTGLNQIFKV